MSASVPSCSSGAAVSNTPRCPPASYPCATTASIPAASAARPSARVVAEASRTAPVSRSAATRAGSGSPKWKLTTGGAAPTSAASIASSSSKPR